MGNKSEKFLITGLPRSRTAWLAALFNTNENVVCFHEAINEFNTLEEMKVAIDNIPKKYVGISDSSIGVNADFYINNFDCRIVIIQRDRKQSLDSYCFTMGFEREEAEFTFELAEKGLAQIKRKPHMIVAYESLNNVNVIKDIWQYCVPELKFDHLKHDIFQNIDITQNVSKVLSGKKFNFENIKLN